jgi:hypothetical protein
VAHPLFDRRHLTAQRDAEARAAQEPPAYHGGANVDELCAEMRANSELLARLLTQERAEIPQLCVTDREPAQAELRNWPAPHARRLIVRRAGNGTTANLAAGVPTLLVDGNEARLGGAIVVSGAGAVTLALSKDLAGLDGKPLAVGSPQLFLAANGGSWDFRLSGLLWCGSVTAIAAANTTVTVAEV